MVIRFLFDLIRARVEFLGHFTELSRKRRPMRCRDLAQAPGALPEKLDLVT